MTGPSPDDPLHVDLNLLADEADFRTLLDGLERLRSILAAPAFDGVRSAELAPGPRMAGGEALRGYVVERLGAAHHPVGACRMGAADGARNVVDSDCRLIGAENIRVVDASITPEIVTGNTNAPTMTIAEKAAQATAADLS